MNILQTLSALVAMFQLIIANIMSYYLLVMLKLTMAFIMSHYVPITKIIVWLMYLTRYKILGVIRLFREILCGDAELRMLMVYYDRRSLFYIILGPIWLWYYTWFMENPLATTFFFIFTGLSHYGSGMDMDYYKFGHRPRNYNRMMSILAVVVWTKVFILLLTYYDWILILMFMRYCRLSMVQFLQITPLL